MNKTEPEINLPQGTYVAAISGGVDSMVMLDLLNKQTGLKLIVAHFDHGIRSTSNIDLDLVKKTAKRYKLPFVYNKVRLGEGASEAEARKLRYAFLNSVREASGANAIVLGHHQDDLLETAVFNLLRGTGRKGLSSLRSRDNILRPLLDFPKRDLIEYAKSNNLTWVEDATNQDIRYKRNYIRHKLLPKIDKQAQAKLLEIFNQAAKANQELDDELSSYLNSNASHNGLSRKAFIMLPHKVSVEVLASWLRQSMIGNFDRNLLTHITVAAKTYSPGQKIDVNGQYFILLDKDYLALRERERYH